MTAIIKVQHENPDRVFFISDLHLGHANIIKYEDRPFKNVTEMDVELRRRWNETIGEDDLVIFVGDLCFYNNPKDILRDLHGRKVLIKGNHDRKIKQATQFPIECKVIAVEDSVIVSTGIGEIFVHHDPDGIPCSWAGWSIYGHVHSHHPMMNLFGKRINVSAEVLNYVPVSLTGIRDRMRSCRQAIKEAAGGITATIRLPFREAF